MVERVFELLYPEIMQAVDDSYDYAFLCGIYILDSDKDSLLAAGNDSAVEKLLCGVRHGLNSAANGDGPPNATVRGGVSEVLSEHASEIRAEIHAETPEQVLRSLLMATSRDNAAVILRQLSTEQRRGLLIQIAERSDNRPLLVAPGPVHDVDDQLQWIARYTAFLDDTADFERFRAKHGRSPDGLIMPVGGKLGPPQKTKGGGPLNLFGPMHAKMVRLLAREQSKRLIPGAAEKGSNSNIAKNLNTSSQRIAEWRKHEHRLSDPWINSEGNVQVTVTTEDLEEMVKIVYGERRGRKRESG